MQNKTKHENIILNETKQSTKTMFEIALFVNRIYFL